MDFAPAWLCARECLDCTLQRAVRARCTRLVPRRESVPTGKGCSDKPGIPTLRTTLNDWLKRGAFGLGTAF
jgi:hypothetical protein